MKCGEFLQRFEIYCRGDMSPAEASAFEKEIEECKYLGGFRRDYETCLELIKRSCEARCPEEEAKLPETFVQTLVARCVTTTVTITQTESGPREA